MAYGTGYNQSDEAKQVNELRKSYPPRLQDAYRLAKSYYDRGNREDTFLSAYTWVLHDCLKRYFAEGTKFYKNADAFRITLSQIRKFPLKEGRDDLFFEQLRTKVSTVCWDLRKFNISALRTLAAEICMWQCGSALYSTEVARPLLVTLRGDAQVSRLVLDWLGLRNYTWSDVLACTIDPIKFTRMDDVAREAILWAVYDDLKASAGSDEGQGCNLQSFIKCLSIMRVVDPHTDEGNEAISYAVGKLSSLGWNFRKAKNIHGIESLLGEAVLWSQESAMHDSKILTMFYVGLKDSPRDVISLAQWYGLGNFGRDEFEPRRSGAETYNSLAQDLTKTYLDALLAKDASSNPVASSDQKSSAADEAITLLFDSRCKDWVWESYSLGNLLVDVGRCKEARDRLARIVSLKPNEPWSWASYGNAWKTDSPEYYERCLFKGLSVARDVRMSLGVHENAMDLFAEKGMYDYAKSEAQLIESCREENGWKPSPHVERLKEESWYAGATAAKDIDALYEKLSEGADDILADGLPVTEFYVEWKDEEKGLVGLVIPKGIDRRGTLSLNRIKMSGNIASLVDVGVCYRGHSDPDKKSIVGTIEECPDAEISSYFISSFAGEIDLIKDFAFVRSGIGSIWVSPSLVEKLEAKQCQRVFGTCRSVFNGKKNSWEWTIASIEIDTDAPISKTRKTMRGELEIVTPRSGRIFGFVNGSYVSEELIKGAGCKTYETYDEVEIEAEKSWDKKKGRWSWRATSLNVIDGPNDEIAGNNGCLDGNMPIDFEQINEKYANPVPEEWSDYAVEWEQGKRSEENDDESELQ